MAISSARAITGLTATGTMTGTLTAGDILLGSPQAVTQYATADIAWAIAAEITTAANTFIFDTTDGSLGASTTYVAGAAQIETATVVAASGCTSNGNCSLTLTSGVVTGASGGLAITVALTTASDTAAKVATALATGLNANAAFAAKYLATTSTADIIITRLADATSLNGVSYYYATDASLNLAIPAGIGITAAATSTGTLAGTVTSGTIVTDGDQKDFQGATIATAATLHALEFVVISGSATAAIGSNVFPLPALFIGAPATLLGAITVTAGAAHTIVKAVVIGETA